MKLVLHIGTEKTGTTLLQNWLYANQNAFSEQGVFLSNLLGKGNNRKLVSYFKRVLDDYARREGFLTQEGKAVFFDGFIEDFSDEIKRASENHEVMVITSEHFHSRLYGPGEIRDLKDFLFSHFSEVKVLCYFREQSQMLESLYSTGLKAATQSSLENFDLEFYEKSKYFDFYDVASRWSSVFGHENCDFRIYDRENFKDRDLRRDFLSALPKSINITDLNFDGVPGNESLNFLEGRLFRVINQCVTYWAPEGGVNPENLFFKRLIRRCARLKVGRIKDLGGTQFSKRFEDSNRAFFDRFFDGRKSFKTEETDKAQSELPQFSIEDLSAALEEVTEVICESVSGRLLVDSDANILRDVALKYETGAPITREEALALMRLAGRARPRGGHIQAKIREWSKTS